MIVIAMPPHKYPTEKKRSDTGIPQIRSFHCFAFTAIVVCRVTKTTPPATYARSNSVSLNTRSRVLGGPTTALQRQARRAQSAASAC